MKNTDCMKVARYLTLIYGDILFITCRHNVVYVYYDRITDLSGFTVYLIEYIYTIHGNAMHPRGKDKS